ncbi:Unknown protein, partial [Striga hermonthica]
TKDDGAFSRRCCLPLAHIIVAQNVILSGVLSWDCMMFEWLLLDLISKANFAYRFFPYQ